MKQSMGALAAFALLAALTISAPARAYTPESGWYWNPAEPGTGIALEIQDNHVFLVGFLYSAAGNPVWLASEGTLTGNALYDGELYAASGGTCLGCAYRVSSTHLEGGHIQISWNTSDPTSATLTWGGRTTPITRFIFGLIRPGDAPATLNQTKLLGEWQMVMDFGATQPGFPYYGDILDFLSVDTSTTPNYIDGCRPDTSKDGSCTSNALSVHSASAYYDATQQRHVIVVDDSANDFVSYVVQVGTNDFSGLVSIYPKGSTPTTWFPVRGFRSASRNFVQTAIGPSSAKVVPHTTAHTVAGSTGTNSGIGTLTGPLIAGGRARADIPNARLLLLLRKTELRLHHHDAKLKGALRH